MKTDFLGIRLFCLKFDDPSLSKTEDLLFFLTDQPYQEQSSVVIPRSAKNWETKDSIWELKNIEIRSQTTDCRLKKRAHRNRIQQKLASSERSKEEEFLLRELLRETIRMTEFFPHFQLQIQAWCKVQGERRHESREVTLGTGGRGGRAEGSARPEAVARAERDAIGPSSTLSSVPFIFMPS
jgi:hypothetical protein